MSRRRRALLWIGGIAAGSVAALAGAALFLLANPVRPLDDEIINTNLLALQLHRVEYNNALTRNVLPGRNISLGSVASAGDEVLIQKDLRFFHLDLESLALTRLAIAPPDNGRREMFAYMSSQPQLRHLVDLNDAKMAYTDMALIRRGERWIFLIAYNYWNMRDHCYGMRLARTTLDAGPGLRDWRIAAGDWRIIFETRPCIRLDDHFEHFAPNEAGGRLALSARPNHVLLTVGHYGCGSLDDETQKNPASDYGRILEINIKSGAKTVISTGHRNPQGIALDAQTRIWSVEHGPKGGDELNLIEAGKHYGWPFVTYGTDYGSFAWPHSQQQGRHEIYEKPVYAFVPAIGISNLTLIDDFDPVWDGDLLAASLTGRTLYRLRIVEGRVVLAEPIKLGRRIRYVHNHGGGTLIALGDRRILFVIRPARVKSAIEGFDPPQEIAEAARAAWRQCLVCHELNRAGGRGPALAGVIGRRIGAGDFDDYSPGFRRARGRWTPARLRAFLRDPQAVVEGTSMPGPGIGDPAVIEAIVEHLETLQR